MKAEQRKELETNALADRMGHLVRRAKAQPQRAMLYYIIAGVVLVVVLYLVFNYFRMERVHESQRWFWLNKGQQVYLREILKDKDTNAAKAVKFQAAWFFYWEQGVKRLGLGNAAEALGSLDEAAKMYEGLATECKEDPVWEPEALYGLAAIEETRTVRGPEHLESAKTRYEELATKYPKTARGQTAEAWVENYKDTTKRQELTDFYAELRSRLHFDMPQKGLDLQKLLKEHMQKQPKGGK